MSQAQKDAINKANAKVGRSVVYVIVLGMITVFLISHMAIGWSLWVSIPLTIIVGPILGAIMYLPLNICLRISKFFLGSFTGQSSTDSSNPGSGSGYDPKNPQG